MPNPTQNHQGIILFDGVCNFCNRSIQFVLNRDKKHYFLFAQLQSDTGRSLLEAHGLSHLNLSSIIFIENNKPYTKSSAAIRITRHLAFPWPLIYVFVIIPPFLRNMVYDFIGNRRYQWFGKTSHCQLVSPEHQKRFL